MIWLKTKEVLKKQPKLQGYANKTNKKYCRKVKNEKDYYEIMLYKKHEYIDDDLTKKERQDGVKKHEEQ